MYDKSKILALLENAKAGNDPAFAISFALDNNPQAILQNLADVGHIITTPDELTQKQQAFQTIWLMLQDSPDVAVKMLNVPYLDNAPNYTGGFRDWFLRNTQTTAQDKQLASSGRTDFSWGGLVSALGAGLGVYANAAMLDNGMNLQPGTMTPEQQAAAEEAKKKAEEEEARKKKIKMWWWIGGGAAGLLIIILIIWGATRKKG